MFSYTIIVMINYYTTKWIKLIPGLICVFFLSCISIFPPQNTGNQGAVTPQPTPIEEISDPGTNKIESELARTYEYRDKAFAKLNEVKQFVAETIPLIDNCKAPQNMMIPFQFSNTTIAPSDLLYRRHSIVPCEFYTGDAEIAAHNSSNHLNYIESILTEVRYAKELVIESCKNNGMSDYFKALVKNSLLSFQSVAEAEMPKLDAFINDIIQFLAGYKQCIKP